MLANEILSMLKDEISQSEYERYIQKLTFDEENSQADKIVFLAPNIFIANWVKNRYAKKIAYLFESQTGLQTSIEIKVAPKTAQPKKERPKVQEPQAPSNSTKINPTYTFENFVVGSSNQFAYTAALSVAEKLGKLYNPLFIYGGVGLGKTHLLHAIGNYNKDKVVIYATIEQFTNDFIYHIRHKNPEGFREKYRKCDILLIDDIQFLKDKDKTQEEFFHTFNELHNEGKQIVLTSDQPPQTIKGLTDRLKSRFEWGLIVEIQPPELETKIAIIKKKCELNRIELDKEVIHYLAANMNNNIREIEGVILKLNAYSTLVNQKITLDLAKNVLSEQKKDQEREITLQEIVQLVATELNIKPSEIKSKSKKRQIVKARRMVIYLARTLTPNSMPQLAQFFGMKDHSSVSHTMKKVKELIQKDSEFKLKIDELTHKIKSAPVNKSEKF